MPSIRSYKSSKVRARFNEIKDEGQLVNKIRIPKSHKVFMRSVHIKLIQFLFLFSLLFEHFCIVNGIQSLKFSFYFSKSAIKCNIFSFSSENLGRRLLKSQIISPLKAEVKLEKVDKNKKLEIINETPESKHKNDKIFEGIQSDHFDKNEPENAKCEKLDQIDELEQSNQDDQVAEKSDELEGKLNCYA